MARKRSSRALPRSQAWPARRRSRVSSWFLDIALTRAVGHARLEAAGAQPVAQCEAGAGAPGGAVGKLDELVVDELVVERDGASGGHVVGHDHLIHPFEGIHADELRRERVEAELLLDLAP